MTLSLLAVLLGICADSALGRRSRAEGAGVVPQADNQIVSLEVTGPPRSRRAAEKQLMEYAQGSVKMALASALVPTIAEVRVMWFTKIENHIRHLPVLSPVALQ